MPAAGVPKTTTGPDANKRTPGRKRGLAVDVMGLIIGVVVLAASAHDNAVSRVYWASTANMTRRLTTPAPIWRDTLQAAA
ncbi:hypothetical protein [Streptomyces sp. NPDC002402]